MGVPLYAKAMAPPVEAVSISQANDVSSGGDHKQAITRGFVAVPPVRLYADQATTDSSLTWYNGLYFEQKTIQGFLDGSKKLNQGKFYGVVYFSGN